MKVYIDFDDVLCETAKHFTKIAKELFGIDVNSGKRTVVRRRTDAPSWERRTVIPLSYPGASQKQSSGRDSRRSAPPSGSAQKYFAFVLVIIPAVPRTLFIFSCANYKYSWMIMVVIAYATFVVNIGAKCHPIWRCIDASSLC